MASDTETTQHVKRKRVAKNRKKAWRKHSNIKDVEEFIEDQRMQLRTGGIVAEKPDESLFFVDKKQPLQDKDSSKKSLQKPLKYERKLLPDPTIPLARKPRTPRSIHRPARKSKLQQRLEREDKLGPATSAKRRKVLSAKQASERSNKLKDDEDRRREIGRATYDLWDVSSNMKAPEAKPNEHFLRVTRKTRKKLPKTYHNRPSEFNAVEVVHPGASYNPAFEDHQELIQKAISVELERQKKEDKLERWHKFKKISKQEAENNFMSEMSAGLLDGVSREEKRESASEDEGEGGMPNPPVMAERRKTRRQRNKEKEIKAQLKRAKAEKAGKMRMNAVYRLRALKKEIKAREAKTTTKIAARKAKEAQQRGKTKRLGRYKYEELPIPVKRSTQLVGSLKDLRPDGSLIADRYNSLEKRNLVAPRIWKKGTKRIMRDYEKKSFKEITS
ncbi:ribosome biogenesis protein NOP53-like [Diadema antillarum]|uniref:ribosome biogenesis protein NOP53-like n=1 Tax=Diadema antillarum TaxID=105358 RepID=UPI003A88541E